MNVAGIDFAPFVPWPVLAGLALIAALLVGYALFSRARGAVLRAVVLALLLLALANPVITREERKLCCSESSLSVAQRRYSSIANWQESYQPPLRLLEPESREMELGRVAEEVNGSLASSEVVVYTSRELVTAGHVHGASGLDGPVLPAPSAEARPEHAVPWLAAYLLAAPEQSLFRSISVFIRSWTVEAAERVWPDQPIGDVFETLSALVDKSLVVTADTSWSWPNAPSRSSAEPTTTSGTGVSRWSTKTCDGRCGGRARSGRPASLPGFRERSGSSGGRAATTA
jgi:hypothetical protein